MSSRKIKLKRKEIIRYGLPQELKDEKICNLGSYNDKNGNTARALTYEEEEKYMPEIVNLATSDPGFRQAVTTYYKNIRLKVTPIGIELEIGVDSKGNPLNLNEWIWYKHAVNHPWTGKTKQETEGVEHLQFYFEDIEADNLAKSNKADQTMAAYVEFSKLVEDEDKMDWVIRTLLTKYPDMGALSELVKLEPKKKKLKIAEIIEKDPIYFTEVMNDKDLIFKAELASFIDAGVLRKEGNRYLNGTENLGTLDGAIAWMKDQNNSADYAILKARLSEFGTPVPVTKVKKPAKAESKE